MLPADLIAEITTNVSALLPSESNLAAQILAAVFAPLLRNDPNPPVPKRRHKRAGRPRVAARRRKNSPVAAARPPRRGRGRRPTQVRERAISALKAAAPGASLTAVAAAAKCSRGTVKQARADLGAEGLKPAPKPTKPLTEPRLRAQRFLKDTLAHGPKPVTAVEEAATKAHVELHVLEQARADLGILTTRANTGGAHAVQWSLPA